MAKEKKLYTFVDVDDNTPVQKLSIIDQFRVLLHQITYDAASELHNDDIVTTEFMTLKANLSEFIRRATEPIRRGEKRVVIVNISSKFNPVFDEVTKSHEVADFFYVDVVKPKLGYDIPYDFLVRFTVKEK